MKNILEKRNRNYNNLINKIGIIFVIQLFLSLIIIYYFGNYLYDNSVKSDTKINLNTLKSITVDINKEISYFIKEENIIVKLASYYSESDIKKLAQNILRSDPQILKVSFYDKNLKPSWSVSSAMGKEFSLVHNIKSIPLEVLRDNIYIEETGTYVHYVLYPIYNENKENIGVVEFYYDISYIWSILSDFDVDNIYITDRHGKILVKKSSVESADMIFDKNIFKQYLINIDDYISYNIGEIKVSGIASKIKTVDWVLIVEDSVKEEMNDARLFLHLANSLVAILVLINVYIIFLIYKKIYKPFRILNKFSEEYDKNTNLNTLVFNDNIFVNIIGLINKLILSNKLIKNNIKEEIEIKTRQLTKNIKEAETMSALMVNRELKMINLKNENLEIKNKLKKITENKTDLKK